MAVIKIEALPEEPILIATFGGHITPMDTRKTAAFNADYLEKHGGHAYAIADLLQVSASFPETLMVIRNESQGQSGTSTDPHLTVILVATNEFATLFVETLKQAGVQIPIFTDLDDAIDHARDLIKKEKR